MRTFLLASLVMMGLVQGCLVFAQRPCAEGDCPSGFACEPDGSGCLPRCYSDRDCQDGYYCSVSNNCLGRCINGMCPGGFAYEPGDLCLTSCEDDEDCVEGYHCCTSQHFGAGLCDEEGDCWAP